MPPLTLNFMQESGQFLLIRFTQEAKVSLSGAWLVIFCSVKMMPGVLDEPVDRFSERLRAASDHVAVHRVNQRHFESAVPERPDFEMYVVVVDSLKSGWVSSRLGITV